MTEAPPPKQTPKIYLESRYRKLQRGLPQTVFFCPDCKGHRRRRKDCARCEGFGKLTKDSVQELLAREILPAFRARSGKFHGAGREDIDVLMLGRGRPFVYEVIGAKVPDADLDEIWQRIQRKHAGRMEIDPFEKVGKSRVAFWKESKFAKVYRLRAVPEAPVDEARLQDLAGQTFAIVQRTPQRVAFRRADLERERSLRVEQTEVEGDASLVVDVRCEHGTYVKEWVSGDGGRTRPSLTELLGVACACEQLDVLDILTEAPDPQA